MQRNKAVIPLSITFIYLLQLKKGITSLTRPLMIALEKVMTSGLAGLNTIGSTFLSGVSYCRRISV